MAARTRTEQRLPDDVPLSGVIVAGSTAAQQRSRDARIAGVLLSLAGAAILMGFITAEALYPGVYTTHANTVSHLGASEPPNSVVLQPSATGYRIVETTAVTDTSTADHMTWDVTDLGFRMVVVRMPAPFDRETVDRMPEVREHLAA